MLCAPSLIPCLRHHHRFHRHHHHYHPRFRFHCSRSPWNNLSRRGGDRAASPFGPSNVFRIPPCSVSFSGLSTGRGELDFRLQKMSSFKGSSKTSEDIYKFKQGPGHLLVLVHGIMASPSDWTYAKAELERELGNNFLIYASSCNSFTRTFDGIDRAGRRLADEVLSVVKENKSLKRISFLAHSLGGLFMRYAIAVLYSSDDLKEELHEEYGNGDSELQSSLKLGKIGALEPINLITLATPHLGVRGRNQLPFLLGLPILERLAAPLAPILVGRTGRQLFLTDEEPDKPPLLLRMVSDCEDIKFISSLASFRNRVLYANVSYDHMVGWRTSSIRRETELPQPPLQSINGYKHIVDVQCCPSIKSEGLRFPSEAAKAKEAAQTASNTQTAEEYYELMEEEMIHGLQRVGWKKVDVSFHSAMWPFFAHNNIHVKNEWLHNAGAGVIARLADCLKQQQEE